MSRTALVLQIMLLLGSNDALAGSRLTDAAMIGDEAAVRSMLDSGVGVDERDQALFFASKAGHTEIVSLLLAHLSDPNFVMSEGTCCGGWSPLLIASPEGHPSTVEVLLRAGANANIRNSFGRPPLNFAAMYGYNDIVRLLLDHGADVNARPTDGEGVRPLGQSAYRGKEDTVDLLLEHGADVNAVTDEGMTVLMLAAGEGHAAVVDRLLAHGAKVDTEAAGVSALALAIKAGHDDIAKRLLTAGADPNGLYPGPRGVKVSMLMLSVVSQRESVVVALFEKGAVVNFRIDNGRTALDFAETMGNRRIADLLKQAGASRGQAR